MFRNQYDTDVTMWSPHGRLHQVEYAMEAVNLGSTSVGLRSNTHVVLATLMRASAELASHQQKLFQIDNHIGIAISGLTADARVLAKYMRSESLNHKFVYESPITTSRLVSAVADKHQQCTQSYVRRPYGVGLLVAGFDKTGPRLFQTCPSGNYFEYISIAIGSRYQSSKTYLERNFESFAECNVDELIVHGLKALQSSTMGDMELTKENCAIGIVGVDQDFQILTGDVLEPYIGQLESGTQAEEPVQE